MTEQESKNKTVEYNDLTNKWLQYDGRSRAWENMYRSRWDHTKIVRSTHGVNCTGSCSWQVYVKDGIITWETQQTDYPSNGKDFPEYEPRGCPRGATFSWYTYSPMRVKYPYVRGALIKLWRELRKETGNPVTAWEKISGNSVYRDKYVKERGKGGFVRSTWEEISEIIAASLISTIKKFGPDRVMGFTPIPAMSMVSYSAGSRFLSLIGGSMLSFYDWYADLPPASPQIWGEQTDVPESADWYNAKYFIIWGTNLPQTRTPDAHFMVEARYNGTKVVGVSPDYAEYIKFSDVWLPAKAGTDAALALSMAHVIVKEFYVDREEPYFTKYAKKFTDLPFLVILDKDGDSYKSGRFLRSSDLGNSEKYSEWKTVMWDGNAQGPIVPGGSLGFRWDGSSRWNLDLKSAEGDDVDPVLSFFGMEDGRELVQFPQFDGSGAKISKREVPVKKLKLSSGKTVSVVTVFDLFAASLGVPRGMDGEYPKDYESDSAYTPAWQERITGVDRKLAIKVAREFAENAAKTKGKSMIAMGAGTNHWYNSDVIYRSIISLVILTGSQGVNGGGWAHYVGQEKVRPFEGWSNIAFALDWYPNARLQNGTSFFYLATDQFRYEQKYVSSQMTPFKGKYSGKHPADLLSMAVRLGWQSSYPQTDRNPVELAKEIRDAKCETDVEAGKFLADKFMKGELKFSTEDPDNPLNFPRVLFLWRSNLLGASGKGHEYFIKHLLGSSGHPLGDHNDSWKPNEVRVPDPIPEGKLDLMVDIDFRMASSALYSDIVLPAATWYEKYDVSSTDMHPFVHPFSAAISPPWQAKSDWETFKIIARKFSDLAEKELPEAEDLMLNSMQHDSLDEMAQPMGVIDDWLETGEMPIAGKNFPKVSIQKRDFAHVFDKMVTLGPLEKKRITAKGITIDGEKAYSNLLKKIPAYDKPGIAFGFPSLLDERHVVDAILALSGATNGKRSQEEWEFLSKKTGVSLSKEFLGNADTDYSFDDLVIQPRRAIAAPSWSGDEGNGRRYSPFTINVDYSIPWRTLTGRQAFYLDHQLMIEMAECLPIHKPPLGPAFYTQEGDGSKFASGKHLTVRYLTPHQKWGIHSTYADTPMMLTLFRGGQCVWINEEDAKEIDVKDNDWVEVYNMNGVVVARAVLTYRIPRGDAIMYHAQDRTVGTPGSEITNDRGGTHNSVTKIILKPTHMIGGYAQLSFFFNYYGPTGHQRDATAFIRKLTKVNWLES